MDKSQDLSHTRIKSIDVLKGRIYMEKQKPGLRVPNKSQDIKQKMILPKIIKHDTRHKQRANINPMVKDRSQFKDSKILTKNFQSTINHTMDLNLNKLDLSMGSLNDQTMNTKLPTRLLSPLQKDASINFSFLQSQDKSYLSESIFQQPSQEKVPVQKITYEHENVIKEYTMIEYIDMLLTMKNPKKEFCYMNKRHHFYDFEIVEYGKINKDDYLTVSARGVTLNRQEQVEFFTLKNWLKQVDQFQKLQKISFFKTYRILKHFLIWRTFTRQKIMKVTRDMLRLNYFNIDPSFTQPLSQFQTIFQHIQNISNFDYNIDEPKEFEKFVKFQLDFRDIVMIAKMNKFQKETLQILYQCCGQSLKYYMKQKRINIEQQEQKPLLIGDESQKNMTYTVNATIKHYQFKLQNFVKYIDQQLINAKLIMLFQNLRKLSGFIDIQTQNTYGFKLKSSWFIIEISIDDQSKSIKFEPDLDTIYNYFLKLLVDTEDNINRIHHFLIQDEKLQNLLNYESNLSDLQQVSQITKGSQQYTHTKNQYLTSLKKNIHNLEKYHNSLKPYLEMYLENIKLEPLKDEIDLDYFTTLIDKFQNQDSKLQQIEKSEEIGIFFIDKNKFKNQVKNCAQKTLAGIYQQLPQIFKSQTLQFLSTITELNNKMTFTISESSSMYVEHFVQFTFLIQRAQNFDKNESNKIHKLNSFQELLKSLKVRVDDSLKINLMHCNNLISALKQKIEAALSEYDSNLSKSNQKLQDYPNVILDQLKKQLNYIQSDYFSDINQNSKEVLKNISELRAKFQNTLKLKDKYEYFSNSLNLSYQNFPIIDQIDDWIKNTEIIQQSRVDLNEFLERVRPLQFLKLSKPEFEQFINKMKRNLNISNNFFEQNSFLQLFSKDLDQLVAIYDLVICLQQPTLRENNWEEIQEVCESLFPLEQELFKNIHNEEYSFSFLETSGIQQFYPEIQMISIKAQKIYEIMNILDRIESFWGRAKIKVITMQNTFDEYVIQDNEDLISEIDEIILQLNSILSNRYIQDFKTRVEEQIKKFKRIQDILDDFYEHQKIYLYLEPIVLQGINHQGFQKEQSQFKKAQVVWKNILRRIRDTQLCKFWIDDSSFKNYKEQLKQNIQNFEQIQRILQEYLDKKREQFLRFFFLSNLELLDCLSKSQSPQLAVPYMKKIFDNLDNLDFSEDGLQAMGIISQEGEILPLKSCVFRTEQVEDMMQLVQDQMTNNLKSLARNAMMEFENFEKFDWIQKYPCQITILIDNQQFTQVLEENYLQDELNDPDLQDEYGQMDQICMKIILDIEEFVLHIRKTFDKILKLKMMSILTQNVNQRDITKHLYEQSIVRPSDFYWQRQQKVYYYEEIIQLKMLDATMPYGYEYVGAFARLVITPLTDRCFLTIATAFQSKLGANPAGPAGTGKTECCKDLAKICGRQCIVFNCSDSNDTKTIEKLLVGQITTGCWCCFDEFNRIEIEVLSVISSQINIIRNAQLEKRNQFEFYGKLLNVSQNSGIFATFNPGYMGRAELPDNVKVLFRPIAMVIPDYQIVSENLLYALGFQLAPTLSTKLTVLQQICAQQFTNQYHYDFGMRSLKSIISHAGNIKQQHPNVGETQIMYDALYDLNAPKLNQIDLQFYLDVLQDLFPGMYKQNESHDDLKSCLTQAFSRLKLQFDQKYFDKVQQLINISRIRFGTCILGSSMSGKSTIINLFYETQNLLHQKNPKKYFRIESKKLNPKAVDIQQLYGKLDIQSQVWQDGLISQVLREQSFTNISDLQQWIVLDGPQDTLWIENLNTVLDDSKVLCLSNGERIKLNDTMKMIFETDHMRNVSPATVSRCGIIYLMESQIDDRDFVKSFFQKFEDEKLTQFFENFLCENISLYQKINNQYQGPIQNNFKNSLKKVMIYIENFLFDPAFQRLFQKAQEITLNKARSKILLYSLIWGLSTHLNDKYQMQIAYLVQDHDQFRGIIKTNQKVEMIFNSFLRFDKNAEGDFFDFEEVQDHFKYKKNIQFSEIHIPTNYSIVYKYIFKTFAQRKENIFLTGLPGNGKSQLINYCVSQLNKVQKKNMVISHMITNNRIIDKLTVSLDTIRKKGQLVLTGPVDKTTIFIIDDINLAKEEELGSQPPIEFLRQLLDQGGFFDVGNLQFKLVENVLQYIVASHPGGNRYHMTQRYTKFFNIFNYDNMDTQATMNIFSKIIEGFLVENKFKNDIVANSSDIIKATLDLVDLCKKHFLQTYLTQHYSFSLRDIAKIVQGVLLANSLTIKNPDDLIQLWAHEVLRVLSDRFIKREDFQFLLDKLDRVINYNFSHSIPNIHETYYCIFLHNQVGQNKKFYECSKNISQIQNQIQNNLPEDSLNLIIFQEACEYILKLTRITLLQNSHGLFVAQQGSGKRTLIRLSAIMVNAKFVQIDINAKTTIKLFRQELFQAFAITSAPGVSTICYINDLLQDTNHFLEDIHSFVSTGEIIDLINREDQEKIKDLFDFSSSEQEIDKVEYFKEILQEKFHIMFGMSPLGNILYNRMRLFPSLTNIFNVIWLLPYPGESYVAIAHKRLEKDLNQFATPEFIMKLSNIFNQQFLAIQEIQEIFKEQQKLQTYVTTKMFIHYIDVYLKNYFQKKSEISGEIQKLTNGVKKLQDAKQKTFELKQTILKLQPILQDKTVEIQELIQKLSQDQMEANMVKKVVEQEANDVNIQQEKIILLKAEADQILKEAQPIYQAALEQLDKLNRGDISEIKMNQNPHALVKFTVECLAIILEQPTDWDSCRKNVLSDANLLSKLKNINVENLQPNTFKKFKKTVQSNSQFQPNEIKNINMAAKSLCEWAHALVNFNEIYEQIKAKRENQKIINQNLQQANQALKEKQKQLDDVINKVQILEKTYLDLKNEKENLDRDIKQAEERLVRANILTEGLADEEVRWNLQSEFLQNELKVTHGNCFLITTALFYNGPYQILYRNQLLEKCKKICNNQGLQFSDEHHLEKQMVTNNDLKLWDQSGLQLDKTYTQNAVIALKSDKYPIMIDPQDSAFHWIQNLEQEKNIVIAKSYSENTRKILEECIQSGQPMMILDIEDKIPLYLDFIIQPEFELINNKKCLKFEDQSIEFKDTFFLYLISKNQIPQFLPDVYNQLSIINFSISLEGLNEQLSNIVINYFMPDDGKLKKELKQSIQEDRINLKQGEDKLLDQLTNSKGMILDDFELIEQLKISKEISKAVEEKIIQSIKKEKEIDQVLVKFESLSKRAALIYNCIKDLQKINIIYQFSLEYFQSIFLNCLKTYDPENIQELNIQEITNQVTQDSTRFICQGLFNSHKRIFIFIIVSQICLIEKKTVVKQELDFFLSGLPKNILQEDLPKNISISQDGWNKLNFIRKEMLSYNHIIRDITIKPAEWQNYLESSNMTQLNPPCEISSMQKLILVQFFQPQRVIQGIDQYIEEEYLKSLHDIQPLSNQEILDQITIKNPLFILIKKGQDPSSIFHSLAHDIGLQNDQRMIVSLGQGQNEIAEEMINECMQYGNWLLIQNCHLGQSFMPILERILQSFSDQKVYDQISESFRLFITTEMTDVIPQSILYMCIKYSTEPPLGLRNTLLKQYNNYNEKQPPLQNWDYEGQSQFIYSLNLFHAIIQERGKFGPIGFCNDYHFNQSDLDMSFNLVNHLFYLYDGFNWSAIKYMIGNIVYGGRITNNSDIQILNFTLERFCNQESLQAGYQYSKNPDFKSILELSVEESVSFIQSLPQDDPPDIYGLAENVSIKYQNIIVQEVYDLINMIIPKQITKDNFNQQKKQLIMQLQTYLKEMPKKVETKGSSLNFNDPINKFLLIELDRFNKLLEQLHQYFNDLLNAMQGFILKTQELIEIQNSLFQNKLPNIIRKISYPSLKTFSTWMNDLQKRYKFYLNWVQEEIPKSMWISGLFFPQGLLGAFLQNHARKHKRSLDQVTSKFILMSNSQIELIDREYMDGCLIYGLFSEGFKFESNNGKIQMSSDIGTQLYHDCPSIYFQPRTQESDDVNITSRQGALNTTGISDNFIISIGFKSTQPQNFWSLCGAALFCSIPN